MKRLVLRVRPEQVMEDLNIDEVSARIASLTMCEAEVRDTRLSDGTYVSVEIKVSTIDTEFVAQMRAAFCNLPQMRVFLWRRAKAELPLSKVDLAAINDAGESG